MNYQNENFDGQYDFRCRRHKGYHMEPNLHEYSELLYCEKGSGLVTVNGERVTLREGELVWIPPNYIHQYDFDTAEVVCAVFSNDFIPLFFKELGNRSLCISPVNMSHLSEILHTFPEMKKESSLRIGGYLNLICACVIEESRFKSATPSDGVLYQKIISYLSENYTESITLSHLATVFGYNVKYLSHFLHTLTGIHFRQLLNFYRISRAKALLKEKKDITISTVALACGFSAVNTFNREFKRIVGKTPNEYKKECH